MYRSRDHQTPYLFEELFPFGGKLDDKNRWLQISKMIPWDELDSTYRGYFSKKKGRPGTDSRLATGLFLLKHMNGASDEGVVASLRENIYWQAFCGFEQFETGKLIDPSTMTKLRKRMGKKYFKEMEDKTYDVLIKRKIIKAKGMLVDGTVFGEKVKYPNDVSLLNDVRKWTVEHIKKFGKKIGTKYRTYCRKGKQSYLKYSKKRRKTKKEIRKSKKEMLQYVRRNLDQFQEVVEKLKEKSKEIHIEVLKKLETAKEIYRQQLEMYRTNSQRIEDRIVSFYRDYVRPIKRGKSGKNVEFGVKAALSHVDGFLFLDEFSHDNFSEAKTEVVEKQLSDYEKRFGRKPSSFTGDRLYGNRGNRELMKEKDIKTSFVNLGRKKKEESRSKRWLKKKQRERNRIEGHFGHGKQHYRLDEIRYHGKEGAEMWLRGGILGMNLVTAMGKL